MRRKIIVTPVNARSLDGLSLSPDITFHPFLSCSEGIAILGNFYLRQEFSSS
jgi:hypothetical protein